MNTGNIWLFPWKWMHKTWILFWWWDATFCLYFSIFHLIIFIQKTLIPDVCLTIFICPLIVNRLKCFAWIMTQLYRWMCVWCAPNRSNCVGRTDNRTSLQGSLLYLIILGNECSSQAPIIIPSSFSYFIHCSRKRMMKKQIIDPFFCVLFNMLCTALQFQHLSEK